MLKRLQVEAITKKPAESAKGKLEKQYAALKKQHEELLELRNLTEFVEFVTHNCTVHNDPLLNVNIKSIEIYFPNKFKVNDATEKDLKREIKSLKSKCSKLDKELQQMLKHAAKQSMKNLLNMQVQLEKQHASHKKNLMGFERKASFILEAGIATSDFTTAKNELNNVNSQIKQFLNTNFKKDGEKADATFVRLNNSKGLTKKLIIDLQEDFSAAEGAIKSLMKKYDGAKQLLETADKKANSIIINYMTKIDAEIQRKDNPFKKIFLSFSDANNKKLALQQLKIRLRNQYDAKSQQGELNEKDQYKIIEETATKWREECAKTIASHRSGFFVNKDDSTHTKEFIDNLITEVSAAKNVKRPS